MTTTTPDNIRTPDIGTPYNLIPDLATLASDTQEALKKRANLYTGTAAQREAFTSAVNGVSWKDTNGLQLMWTRVAGVWRPSDQYWRGTTTERNTLTSVVSEGFTWYNTTTKAVDVFDGSTWQPTTVSVAPPAFTNSTYVTGSAAQWDRTSKFISLSVAASRTVWNTGGATAFAAAPFGCRPPAAKNIVVSWSGAAAPKVTFGQITADGTITAYDSPTNGQSWVASISTSYSLV